MTPADRARNNAISLEAKKDALSQRQSGDWKVSFTVQGIDMDTRLTQAPMGTRYAVVLVEIGDDETPVNRKEAMPNHPTKPAVDARPQPTQPQAGAKREKMDWRDMQPAAQAALRCDQPAFQAFLREEHGYISVTDTDSAANAVRHLCVVKSRSEFSTDHRKRVLWKQLDDQFSAWKVLEHA
jgi:hypothetical protein